MSNKVNEFPTDLVGSILRQKEAETTVAEMRKESQVDGALFLEERYKHLVNHPDKKTGYNFEASARSEAVLGRTKDKYIFKAKSEHRTYNPKWVMMYIPGNMDVEVTISGNYIGCYSFSYTWPLHELDERLAKFALLGTVPDKVRKVSGG